MLRLLLPLLIFLAGAQSDGDRFAQRVSKIDERYLKTLTDLSMQFDKSGDIEAAHFFAECAMGFGSKDEMVKAIRWDTERRVYLGSTQGGKPLEKPAQISTKLEPIAKDYKQVMSDLEKQGALTEGDLRLLRDLGVKYELAVGAAEYITATKRINALRNGMKLRSVLWDFENSSKLIRGCAPAAEVWSIFSNASEEKKATADALEKAKGSRFWDSTAVEFLREKSNRWFGDLAEYVDLLRSVCLRREDLLNPNARRLWLGHWRYSGNNVRAYAIPLLSYRDDVPTPSSHYSGETTAKDWVTIEDLLEANGHKIPFAHYPFRDETELPSLFGGSAYGYIVEEGWGSDDFFKNKLGLPIMLRFFGGEKLTEVEAKLVASRTGKELAIRVYTNGDPAVPAIGKFPTVIVLPVELGRNTPYTVTIKGKLDGVAFDRTWSFTTKAK